MILPKVVTFTGADDTVKAKDLLKVSKDYPDVEWGILFGAGPAGGSRFPSYKWLAEELPKLEGNNLCAHFCGRWVDELVQYGDFTWFHTFDSINHLFKRIQLNFHGARTTAATTFLARIQYEPYQFIFQNDEVNTDLIGSKGTERRVHLYDVSHGAGVLPDARRGQAWPKRTMHEYLGYAGGLGPDNIEAQLPLIEAAANPTKYGPYWIDMESKVRGVNSKTNRMGFDLGKVRTVCEKVWGTT